MSAKTTPFRIQNLTSIMLFQTSFGIPAEGVYTGLVVILLLIIAALVIMVVLMARRNMQLVDDNRKVTEEAIRGFEKAFHALERIQQQVSINSAGISEKLSLLQGWIEDEIKTLKAHIQYLRDRAGH